MLYSFASPISLSDPSGLDNPGCDLPDLAKALVGIDKDYAEKLAKKVDSANALDDRTRYVLECCAQHDYCYEKHGCTQASWSTTFGWGAALNPFCTACNWAVIACILPAMDKSSKVVPAKKGKTWYDASLPGEASEKKFSDSPKKHTQPCEDACQKAYDDEIRAIKKLFHPATDSYKKQVQIVEGRYKWCREECIKRKTNKPIDMSEYPGPNK